MRVRNTGLLTYDYLEERPLGAKKGVRRRNMHAILTERPSVLWEAFSASYGWRKARELEGTANEDDALGVWGVSGERVARFHGNVLESICPQGSRRETWPADVDALARRKRLHHYFRVRTSDECIRLLLSEQAVTLSLEITREWFNPPHGVIPVPSPRTKLVGAHCISLLGYEPEQDWLAFPNSWGEEWGDRGWGYLPRSLFDTSIIEAWGIAGPACVPPTQARSGIIQLLWKSSVLPELPTHGREIVDANTGDRLAWSFAIRKGEFLDVEEMFVWPDFRGRGYGRALAKMLLELAAQMGARLRMWVPFADCEPDNRDALDAAVRMLGLELHPSPERWAGYVALDQVRRGPLPALRRPPRPASTREDLAAWQYEVWYGTNRALRDVLDSSKGFGTDRSQDIHCGKCEVVIPKSHNFGSIGSSWWKRWMQGSDDRLRLLAAQGMAEPEFWADIRREIGNQDESARHSMVFLHGYNVSFEEAAIRAAQIGFDLKIGGVMAFFSWPSQGSLLGYPVDEATIEASEAAITRFLTDFVGAAGDDPVHLLAHSMGNRGLLRSLQRIMSDVQEQSRVRFGQIFILAPDIDVDLFKSLANVYAMFAQRTTLYASPADRALEFSRWLHTYPRAGFTPPITIAAGIDTIQVPGFNLLDLGHSYYAEAGPVLHDLFDLIRRNAAPSERQRLVQVPTDAEEVYWRMIR